MKLLFPSSDLDSKKINEDFELEYNAAQTHGFETHIYNEYKFIKENIFESDLPIMEQAEPLILRGWMMKIDQYEKFYQELINLNYLLVNTPEEYKNCHHFPLIHHLFSEEDTSKLLHYPNTTKEDIQDWSEDFLNKILFDLKSKFSSDHFILKDSVKSEKDIPDLFIIPCNIQPEELRTTLLRFIEVRGNLYNPGITFKEIAPLKKYQEKTINEYRIYVMDHEIVSTYQNTCLKSNWEKDNIVYIPGPFANWVMKIIQNIPSNFFTIDVAELEGGGWTVIETGDAQVSGLSPGQNELLFYESLRIKSAEIILINKNEQQQEEKHTNE